MEISRREVSVRRRAVPLAQALVPLVEEWSPDLVLRDATELAGWAVAERYNLFHASIEVGQHWTPTDWYGSDGSAVAALRAAIGLASDDEPPSTLYRYLHFSSSPPGFLPHDVQLPNITKSVRPTFHDDYGQTVSIPDYSECVYIAFSTVYQVNEKLVRELAIALAASFEHVLVSGSFATPKPNITVYRYIPQSLVMSRCAVVVCHGGRNTVLTALAAGVPVVCAPIASDQFFISSRVSKLKVGRACSWNARELGAAASQIASHHFYRNNARRFARLISMMPAIKTVAATTERKFEDRVRDIGYC